MCLGAGVGRRTRVGGGREGHPFVCMCGRVLCAPGGGGCCYSRLPGKQCPRRVFYGSCWTLISFVPHLSRAAAALSPAKACAHPTPLPHPLLLSPPNPQKKPCTTRSGFTGVRNWLPNIPHGGKCVTNQFEIKSGGRGVHAGVCIKKN